ncbi:uncharacterized protein LOC129894823 [Solanum dulcamara]|uniref:uncharacterized protein LOC129894823 n=1 Tax=Solanum dulcamara TaxID=45834 RepID=UPI0024864238|nr:uncharacterized protein LOC129894823 [Solanum dulcamara]
MKASDINKSGMFKIRTFNPKYTYSLKDKVYSQRQITSNLIGGIVKPKLIDHKRKYTPRDIKNDVKMEQVVDFTYQLAWGAKEKALNSLRGMPARSYGKLPGYLYILSITYPGSHICLKKTGENEFLYLFVAFDPFIYGFEHCRHVLVMDGSHLGGSYNETFVAASTLDGAGINMCVVSDRNESVIKAVTRVYNDLPHYACM